jgi:hypothetical protein
MGENEKARNRNRDIVSPAATEEQTLSDGGTNSADVAGILDERIRNLREAIEEIDAALAQRKVLDVRFIEQIDREAEEVKRHLNMLNAPWQTGFYPELEFLRLSFHKSLTSRAKERRSEQLKYWENGVNLAKERRKFLDEYKALVGMRRRLTRNEDR